MPNLKLAFDKSARHVDADGRLHVERSHISKAAVNPYYGREIPGFESLGLQPDKVYRLFRDPVELERGAPTFARLPILSEHVPVTVDSPQPDLVVGAIGSDVQFNAPYLDADLCVWDAEAIAGIETDKVRELSCAYRYVPVMEPGEYEGEAYDGRMTEIRGNHLALVETGRAGADVIVADSNPFSFKETSMRMSKLGKALFAALSAASPVLAADSALPALVGSANRKTFKPAEVKAKLLALDGDLDPQQLDNVIDALLDVEQTPTPMETPQAAADASPADQLKALLAGKVDDAVLEQALALIDPPAADEGASGGELTKSEESGMKPEEVKTAMDAYGAQLRAELRQAAEAARDVRDVVGDVIGMDSAAEVYAFALDHMKVDHKDVEGVAALRALFKVASAQKQEAPRVAQDAAPALAMFPGLSRFRNA
jgi:hypothetical protein